MKAVNRTTKITNQVEFLDTVLNNIHDIIMVIDAHSYRILGGNKAFLKSFGLTETQAKEKTCYEVTHRQSYPCKPPHDICPLEIANETGKPSVVEHVHFGKKGEAINVEISAFPVKDKTGKVKQIIHVSRDITDRKKVEEQLKDALQSLRKALGGTIEVIALTVEMKDPFTAGHQKRVANLARAIATEMKLPPEQIDGIRIAGAIHDIGKISVPSEILSKPSQLSTIEFEIIRNHPSAGYQILKEIDFPWPVAKIILQHHERINGSGYPAGITGKDIVLEAKVLAVADVVEAMASHRPYRPALAINKALKEVSQNKGTLYDEQAVNACLRLFTKKNFKLDSA